MCTSTQSNLRQSCVDEHVQVDPSAVFEQVGGDWSLEFGQQYFTPLMVWELPTLLQAVPLHGGAAVTSKAHSSGSSAAASATLASGARTVETRIRCAWAQSIVK